MAPRPMHDQRMPWQSRHRGSRKRGSSCSGRPSKKTSAPARMPRRCPKAQRAGRPQPPLRGVAQGLRRYAQPMGVRWTWSSAEAAAALSSYHPPPVDRLRGARQLTDCDPVDKSQHAAAAARSSGECSPGISSNWNLECPHGLLGCPEFLRSGRTGSAEREVLQSASSP